MRGWPQFGRAPAHVLPFPLLPWAAQLLNLLEGPYLLYSLSYIELQKSALKIKHEKGKSQSPRNLPPSNYQMMLSLNTQSYICLSRAEGTLLSKYTVPQNKDIVIPLVNIRNRCTYVQSFSEYCNYIYLPALACKFFCGRLKPVFYDPDCFPPSPFSKLARCCQTLPMCHSHLSV